MSQTRVPGATYRLQLHAAFGFSRARAILGYLRALGVTVESLWGDGSA